VISRNTHLSDDELDEILIGIATVDASTHLAGCSACGDRFAAFQSQLDSFNHATMAWSEARANTISRDIAAHRPTQRVTLRAAWSSAVGFVVAAHHSSAPAPLAAIHAPMVMPEQEAVQQHEIASDNEMLAAIHSEIVVPDADRLELYESTTQSAPAPHSTPEQARD